MLENMTRWLIYQHERFPLFRHGVLVFFTTTCILVFTAHAQGSAMLWSMLFPAALVGVLAFFQLRVLDEFKDYEIDAKYRPERPVPRGLVTLAELRVLGIAAAVIQLGLVWWLHPASLPLLFIAWAFMALMTAEFFVPEFLTARPALYLLSHQPIVPLLQVLASSWLWLNFPPNPQMLLWLVLVSFGAGVTIEIGRKLRAPEQEREGVETYTASWGIPTALLAWLAGASLASLAAVYIGGAWKLLPLCALGLAVWRAWEFRKQPTIQGADRLENLSGLVVMAAYLALALGGWKA